MVKIIKPCKFKKNRIASNFVGVFININLDHLSVSTVSNSLLKFLDRVRYHQAIILIFKTNYSL